MARPFVTLDVFTRKRFAGNPLAIVLDAARLDTPAMQTIAREFNLPETVFVFPPKDTKHRAKIRIFTPANELPFAGHPTVGTAVYLGAGQGEIVLEEEIGLVACIVGGRADEGRAVFKLPRLPAKSASAPDTADAARAISLAPSDIGFDGLTPSRWSAGVEFTFIPVRSLEAMARAVPSSDFNALIGNNAPGRAFLFCKETTEKGHDYHARMFAPGMGIPEDPATGSAAAAFAGIAAVGRPDGAHHLIVEQGYEMKRPSLIELGFSIEKGAIASATIGGYAVKVGEGMIDA
jgi:trans-2,3-dihydro-3-hydroxyanthranilate isomerase